MKRPTAYEASRRVVALYDGKASISPFGVNLAKLEWRHACALMGFIETVALYGDERPAVDVAEGIIEDMLERFPELAVP